MATVMFLTNTALTSWTVPSNWNSAANTIEVIGAGGSGAALANYRQRRYRRWRGRLLEADEFLRDLRRQHSDRHRAGGAAVTVMPTSTHPATPADQPGLMVRRPARLRSLWAAAAAASMKRAAPAAVRTAGGAQARLLLARGMPGAPAAVLRTARPRKTAPAAAARPVRTALGTMASISIASLFASAVEAR